MTSCLISSPPLLPYQTVYSDVYNVGTDSHTSWGRLIIIHFLFTFIFIFYYRAARSFSNLSSFIE